MSLTPPELELFVAALADSPDLWRDHVRHAGDARVYELIWDEEDVNEKLRVKMERATDAVLDRRAALNRECPDCPVDLRTAALVVAIGRVASVALERGIWP